jgi:hypothetical protein
MDSSPSVHFEDSIINITEKEQFFALCDIMLHGRADGESFGLAVAEMSIRNKPVMTFRPPDSSPAYRTHIQHLGKKGFYYSTGEELDSLLYDFITNGVKADEDYNAYSDFSPEKVMVIFDDVFIKPCLLSKSRNKSSIRYSHHFQYFTFWMSLLSPKELLYEVRCSNDKRSSNGNNDKMEGRHTEI